MIVKDVAIIDHFDSFTYNLVSVLESLGEFPEVISYHNLDTSYNLPYRHIILSPGPDHPKAYPKTFHWLKKYDRYHNILGICLGHQIIGIHYGWEIYQLDCVNHGKKVMCKVLTDSKNSILGDKTKFQVGLYHSWALKNSDNPNCLQLTAVSEQGVVMGVMHQEFKVEGVQFHPESFMTDIGPELISNWLAK